MTDEPNDEPVDIMAPATISDAAHAAWMARLRSYPNFIEAPRTGAGMILPASPPTSRPKPSPPVAEPKDEASGEDAPSRPTDDR